MKQKFYRDYGESRLIKKITKKLLDLTNIIVPHYLLHCIENIGTMWFIANKE